jgi:hypothetical protein
VSRVGCMPLLSAAHLKIASYFARAKITFLARAATGRC